MLRLQMICKRQIIKTLKSEKATIVWAAVHKPFAEKKQLTYFNGVDMYLLSKCMYKQICIWKFA